MVNLRCSQEIDVSIPFEFPVEGVPLSQGAKGKGKWQEHVGHSASQRWHRQSPVAEAVMVKITWSISTNNRRFDREQ